MHPLVANLGKLTDQELDQKMVELTRKYIAAQALYNPPLQSQVLLVLDEYRQEIIRRTYAKQAQRKEGDPDPFASLDVQ